MPSRPPPSARLPGLALLVAGLATASPARAGDPCIASPLVSTCVNSETLWPHAGPQVFATVGGVETVDVGRFGFGLVTDYQSRPIVFHVPGPGPGGTDEYGIDNQANGNFLWAYGVTRRLEIDFALPATFGQNGSGAAPVTGSNVALHDTALRDLRFGVAYQLVPHDGHDGFGLTGRFEVSAPTGDRDEYAGDRTAVFAPSFAGDYQSGRWFAGLELGARIRPDTQVQGANVGTQGTVALGVGYDVLKREKLLAVMVEARSLPTFSTQYALSTTDVGTTETAGNGVLAPSEWMLSLRSAPLPHDEDFAVTLGGGGAITTGDASFTAPRFRFLLGLRYAPTHATAIAAPPAHAAPALDLAAKADACKDDPDTADGFKDTDGCPDEDADKDGVDNRYDRCPLEAEDYVGLTDGCPDAAPGVDRAAPGAVAPSATPTAPPKP